MALGAIARCDQGGLGVQTYDLWRWLQPRDTLVVDLPEGARRGDSRFDRYQIGTSNIERCVTDVIPHGQLVDLAQRCDTILTVECLYAPPATWAAVNDLTTVVLVANPELYVNYPAPRIVLPTMWMRHHVPRHTVIPHPVDVAAVVDRRRVREGQARTFLHVDAPAFLDRNGTDLVVAALPHVTEPCSLIVRSWRPSTHSPFRGQTQIGQVQVVWDDRRLVDWWDGYDLDVDVLVLPRRYGGLSMVVQEAAAHGIPSLMLDIDPQRAESWPGWRIPARTEGGHAMRGGVFDVHSANPLALAGRMSMLARGDLDLRAQSEAALRWADDRSWPTLLPAWRDAVTA